MRLKTSIAALAILAVPAGAIPTAQAAPKRAKLRVAKVTAPPKTVAAGDSFRVTATLVNRGRRTGRGKLRMTLIRGPRPYQVGLVNNVRVRRGAKTRVRISLTVPGNAIAGGYRLRTCIRLNGASRSRCKRSRPLVVTNATPTPTPTASPTASPTTSPTATPAPLAEQVRDAVTVDGMFTHLRALQDIADANGGNRAAGSSGYEASLAYVKSTLEAAGYTPAVQTFDFVAYVENQPSLVERTDVDPDVTIESQTLDYSPSGDVEGEIQTATPNFTPPREAGDDGCEAADFDGNDFTGKIALIQRGTCNVVDKAVNAREAGAIGMILFNAGDSDAPDRNGLPAITLGEDPGIPVVGISYADGEALGTGSGTKTAHVVTDTTLTPTTTSNLIAETPGGNPDRTVLVGSHLDSVPAGPGINDNGTGSAFNLELALQMAKLGTEPKNKMRFAWWGAEEAGLVGSNHYVEQLTLEDAQKIAANLNFDMLGSPNYIRYVYDGDGDAFDAEGPAGSAQIEHDFNDYFAAQGLATAPTAFDGRSDYGGFIAVGIPAGGLFSGAEGEKTQAESEIFGGIPNVAFDPNYHEAGDTINNVSRQGFTELGKGAAYVSGLYAFDRELSAPEIPTERVARRKAAVRGNAYRGAKAVR